MERESVCVCVEGYLFGYECVCVCVFALMASCFRSRQTHHVNGRTHMPSPSPTLCPTPLRLPWHMNYAVDLERC